MTDGIKNSKEVRDTIAEAIFRLDRERRGDVPNWKAVISELRDYHRTTANQVLVAIDRAGFEIVRKDNRDA